jgi:hypothetical protein
MADMAGKIGGEVSEAVGSLRDRASDLSHSATSGVGRAGDAIRGAGEVARNQASAARRSTARTGRDIQHGLDTLMKDQPLVLGAIAMALGAAVGGALPRSRIEDQVLGARSDQAMERVATLAKEQATKVQAVAGAVVEEAMNIADETAADLGGKLPSGEEIVGAAESKIRDAAERLQEAGSRVNRDPSRADTST